MAGESLVAFDDSLEVGLEGHSFKRSRLTGAASNPPGARSVGLWFTDVELRIRSGESSASRCSTSSGSNDTGDSREEMIFVKIW